MDVKSLRRSANTMEEDQLSTVKVEDQTTGFRFVGDYKNDLIIDVEKRERKVTLPEPIQEEKMKPPGQHQEQMMPVKVEDQTTGFRFVRKVTLPEPIQLLMRK